jgi:hypothetical protein
MIVYVDSSVVLRRLLDQPRVIRGWGDWEAAYSSELLGIECRRAIDRLRLEGFYDDQQVARAIEQLALIERAISRIRITPAIVEAASRSMPTVVKTLDAIHLASAAAMRERRGTDLLFATHDAQQGTAARALGFSCLEA